MADVHADAVARLAALTRDRDALAAAVVDRVAARMRADPAARAAIAADVAAIHTGFQAGLYHAVTGLLGPVLTAVFTPPGGVDRDDRFTVDGPLAALRALAATATLVVAPTHSSNLDAIVVGMALRRAGLPACAYATGEHLYRHRAIGALMHRLGGFRVERGRTSARYKLALRTYATVLLERGVHLCVFPGATRSRTNQVERVLHLGLINAGAAAERATGRRVAIVPATVNLQIVLEAATLMAYHRAGRAHERIVGDELFVWGRLRSTARRLSALDQRVAIRFGDAVGADGRPCDPAALPPRPDPAALTAALTAAYHRDLVLFDTHVVARALSDRPAPIARAAALAAIERTATAHAARLAAPQHTAAQRLATALAAWHAGHPERVATLIADHVHIDDPALLLFYGNRCD